MNILIVDDDAVTTHLAALLLQGLGFDSVTIEASGPAALATLDAGALPDVIFCDLSMPGMDGVELIRHLARRRFPGSVVLISGANWRILKTCEELGSSMGLLMIGSVSKPFVSEDFSRILARVCVRKEPELAREAPITPAELRQALDDGQVIAWFQPQVCATSLRPVALEALVRWQHPVRGLISPHAFVCVAEDHGLIDQLLEIVCKASLQHLAQWQTIYPDLRLAINVSTDNLNRVDLPERLERLRSHAGVPAQSVVFEITESRLSKNPDVAHEVLARLRLKGFGLSLDDFGTGYSSLAQLHRMPFTELKIDRAFVHGAARDSRSRAAFESSVQLAQKLGITTVAEGVENQEDLRFAQHLGCDLIQGYLFARPLPPQAVSDWLAKPEVALS